METFTFDDVLVDTRVSFDGDVDTISQTQPIEAKHVESIFFPGCAYLNMSLDIVDKTYKILREANVVQGISLVCCGSLLRWENDKSFRKSHGERLLEALHNHGVKKIVLACPSCNIEFSGLFKDAEILDDIEILALPQVLVELGCQTDTEVIHKELGNTDAKLAFFDACKDLKKQKFGAPARALFKPDALVELDHTPKTSRCCGSLLNAVGKYDEGEAASRYKGQEALDANADALVTDCFSCTQVLHFSQNLVPTYYYLEFLFDSFVDWDRVRTHIDTRFLFEDLSGVRNYKSLNSK
ncbi:MAG: heterodisulfide reductase-related iron-sulfur binding cluster [Coriobacteriia bacterium]|nr:heterodisulfide reductase-related iron-sulfur binding cluster [Coriobacteriia bacterium]